MLSIEYLRQFRIGPFTVFDTVTAYLGILLLSPLLTLLLSKLHYKIPIISWVWLTLPISVLFHFVFRQDTPLMKILSNPFCWEFYVVLAVLLFMTYMGLKDVKKYKKSEQ